MYGDDNKDRCDGEHHRFSFDQHKDSPYGDEHNQQAGDHLDQYGKVGKCPVIAAEHSNYGKNVPKGDGEQYPCVKASILVRGDFRTSGCVIRIVAPPNETDGEKRGDQIHPYPHVAHRVVGNVPLHLIGSEGFKI